MESRDLTELMVELYRRLNHRAPEPEVVERIRQFQEDNGLLEQVPSWLIQAFESLLSGQEVHNILFPSVGSDIGSFLIDVSEIIPGWEHDDQGEWLAMKFPAIDRQIYISREALTPERTASSSYSIKQLAPS